jgi:hypothetical protein
MKKTKVTRLKLDVDHGNDFVLLGLVSSEPDYKLSLSLNKSLGISLKNVTGIKPDDQEHLFSRFSSGTSGDIVYSLISNRSGKSYLLNKLKNIDFLLQIQDYESENDIEKVMTKLRKIEGVTGVFTVETDNLKDKNLAYL